MEPEERKIQLEKIKLMRETLRCLKRIEQGLVRVEGEFDQLRARKQVRGLSE